MFFQLHASFVLGTNVSEKLELQNFGLSKWFLKMRLNCHVYISGGKIIVPQLFAGPGEVFCLFEFWLLFYLFKVRM